ncbi:hypothetical protein E3P99_02643 [Wallemia hederae]|uniref:FHA domain-containing protein n=1 Tax=Wallemia hederae TaxID=1540922 RepID=A0A4T0FJB0_9BASI|nr:hypothetical protein E3P99_02643 [Wallemia hederae]
MTTSSGSSFIFLIPLNNSFELKVIQLTDKVKIGRQTNARTIPKEGNGFFDSKVLSRQHAEIWCEAGKVYIRDVKSSNGTFLNGDRLSPEGVESSAVELSSGNLLEFGIDIIGDDNKSVIHRKVSSKLLIAANEHEYLECQQQLSQQPTTSVSIHKCFDKLEQEIKASRQVSNNLQHISTDFNSIHSSLRGQLPTNYQPSATLSSNPIDVSSIQQQINAFNQQLQSQQKNYEQLLSEHSSLRTQVEQKEERDREADKEAESIGEDATFVDSDDTQSIATQRPKTPEPSASPEQSEKDDQDDDLPSFKELVSQNASLAARLSTLSDELSTMQQVQSSLSSSVDKYDSRLSALEESSRSAQDWRSHWENAFNTHQTTQTQQLGKMIDEYDRKQRDVLSKYQKKSDRRDDKSLKFAGILSIFILGLAAFTVFRGQVAK